eukprot:1137631-Pelagomonas_calceolata.AAC.1
MGRGLSLSACLLSLAFASGAAVVSPQTGCIIANLSLSDLRLITPEHFSVLALPVAEFLALLHNTSYLGYSQKASDPGEAIARSLVREPYLRRVSNSVVRGSRTTNHD